MFLAVLLLVTGLTISTVAIYYSVIGMAAIFPASPIPIYIMFTILEIAKLVGASWLKAHWNQAPLLLKSYMTTAIIVLMILTSMGTFGFLSKSHLDQNIVSGDVADKLAIIEEKIKTQKENIDAARKALKQMDESVDQTVARSSSEKSVTRAVDIRRSQNRERSLLRTEIETAQKEVARLNEERAPIATSIRKVEAEVGPVKYIAALMYGDNPSQTILEKAVTWVIIMIVGVFDPLAVIMLIAAQMTFAWKKEDVTQIVETCESIEEKVVYEDITPNTIHESEFEEIIEETIKETIEEPIVQDPIQRFAGKPIDLLYKEYAVDKFAGIQVDAINEPELAKFIEQNKDKARFNNYSQDALTYYARRIYELRKNNNNNSAGSTV